MKKSLMLALSLIFTLSLAGVAMAQTCVDIHGPIGCAPSPLDGTPVTLTGTVYVVPGTYNSGSMYFQCGVAGGMTLFDSGLVVNEGDQITVDGVVGAFSAEIQLASGAVVTVNGPGVVPPPIPIGTADLNDGTDQLGSFMVVEGLLSLVSSGFNSTYEVDDGSGPCVVFVDGTTGIDTAALDLMLGDIVSIAGSTKCFNGIGELLPRNDGDIVLVSVPTDKQSWGAVKAAYDE